MPDRGSVADEPVSRCPACSADVVFYSDAACQSAELSSVRARCETCDAVYRVRLKDGSLALQVLEARVDANAVMGSTAPSRRS